MAISGGHNVVATLPQFFTTDWAPWFWTWVSLVLSACWRYRAYLILVLGASRKWGRAARTAMYSNLVPITAMTVARYGSRTVTVPRFWAPSRCRRRILTRLGRKRSGDDENGSNDANDRERLLLAQLRKKLESASHFVTVRRPGELRQRTRARR